MLLLMLLLLYFYYYLLPFLWHTIRKAVFGYWFTSVNVTVTVDVMVVEGKDSVLGVCVCVFELPGLVVSGRLDWRWHLYCIRP